MDRASDSAYVARQQSDLMRTSGDFARMDRSMPVEEAWTGSGLQLGRGSYGLLPSQSALRDWGNEIDGGIMLNGSMAPDNDDLRRVADVRASNAMASAQAITAGNVGGAVGGAGGGRGFVNPAPASAYSGAPFAGRSTVTDPQAYVPSMSAGEYAMAGARGIGKAIAGTAESIGYGYSVIGSQQERVDWAMRTSEAAIAGGKRFIDDMSGSVSNFINGFSSNDPYAVETSFATGTGLAIGVGGGVVAGRLQGSPLSSLRTIGSVADDLTPTLNLRYPVHTKPNEAFFWSGRTDEIGGEAVARQIANSNSGTTLEALIENRRIQMPKWDATNPDVVRAWKEISADYASGSSGTVRAVIGQSLRPGNVWEASELPALMSNPNVTRIITIDPVTKAESAIFKR